MASENSPSEFAKIVQSKQTRQARLCGADPELLSSLAGSDAEVMVTIPNEQLEHVAEFQEEADLWVVANVARLLQLERAGGRKPADQPLSSDGLRTSSRLQPPSSSEFSSLAFGTAPPSGFTPSDGGGFGTPPGSFNGTGRPGSSRMDGPGSSNRSEGSD
jgi:hypothetical protein|uniref:Uncharacterized protein n=1 Tax=Zea mays TaxID=4577 RepID=A0A804PQY4_MAIZE